MKQKIEKELKEFKKFKKTYEYTLKEVEETNRFTFSYTYFENH